MEEKKAWWQSRGVWGGLAAVVAGAGAAFGFDLDADQLTESGLAIAAGLGGLLAIYGRIKAKSKIGK